MADTLVNLSDPHVASPPETCIQPCEQMQIFWEGTQFVYHSLALINREQCSNLIDAGVARVAIVPYEKDAFSPDGNAKFEKLEAHHTRSLSSQPAHRAELPTAWIRHQWPPNPERPRQGTWIISQPWEFTTHPEEYVRIYEQADEIWTLSEWSRRSFVNSGIEPSKVHIIPCGVDPELYRPLGATANLPVDKRFKFLFVGGTISRKGIDLLLQAYTCAFNAQDDVCLVIKDMGGQSFYRNQTKEDLIGKARSLPGAPAIHYTAETLSEAEMAALYRACDVFVSPYRAEGFSLPTLEAMACGLPVIVTAGGATDDFVDEEVGWRIPSRPQSVGNTHVNMPLTAEAFVLQAEVDALARLLRQAYEFRAEALSRGIAASARARSRWTWRQATLKVLERLDALCGTAMTAPSRKALADPEDATLRFCQTEQPWREGALDAAGTTYEDVLSQELPPRYRSLALHRLAAISMARGDVAACRGYFARARAVAGDTLDAAYLEAMCMAAEGRRAESVELWTSVLDGCQSGRESLLGARVEDVLVEKARALFECQQPLDAWELYSAALERNPDHLGALHGKARCMMLAGEGEEARDVLRRVLVLSPGFTVAAHDLEQVEAAMQAAPRGPVRLNLGCGGDRREGWINADKYAACSPDVVVDLEAFPWAFEDDSVDEILLKHVLEHVGQSPDIFLRIMQEMYRICRDGATITIFVPHPRHTDFLSDPTHCRPILPETFLHFSLDTNREWQRQKLPGTPLAAYIGVDFSIERAAYGWDEPWRSDLESGRISRDELAHALKTYNNVAREIQIVLRAVKPFRGL